MKINPICFKSDLVYQRYYLCKPMMQEIAEDMFKWCNEHKVPFYITEAVTTAEEDKALNRVSRTHLEGRAIDLSIRWWPQEKIDSFIAYFTHKYINYAAITSTGPKLVVRHDNGNGDHMHIQIKPTLQMA